MIPGDVLGTLVGLALGCILWAILASLLPLARRQPRCEKAGRDEALHSAHLQLEVVRTSNEVVTASKKKMRHLNRKIADYEWRLESGIGLFSENQRDSMARAVKKLDLMRSDAIGDIFKYEAKAEAALVEARRLQRIAARRTLAEVLWDWFGWPVEIWRAIRS